MDEKQVAEHIENALKSCEGKPGIKELVAKLREVPDSYMSFIVAIATYAQKKPERLTAVMDFMDLPESQTTSDIIRFISEQPDFYEDCVEPHKE